MKAVMLSLRPQWCEKIFNGSKTIEGRKSRPSIDMPFKVYVYQTKHKGGKAIVSEVLNSVYGGGKVIGSFVCDRIDEYTFSNYEARYRINDVDIAKTCLTHPELIAYGKGKPLYGWHITEPKLFDKPRALSEFGNYKTEWCNGIIATTKCFIRLPAPRSHTAMSKPIKSKIPCVHKQCSNYSESGCELWSECPVFQADSILPKKQSSKYSAEKVKILGMDFDSRKEARRWFELRTLEQAGEISNLQRQVKYVLIPAQREMYIGNTGQKNVGKVLERECSYRADFVYVDKQGHTVVEDVKGYKRGGAYEVFVIKRKLMLWRYGIKVKEV